jgi:ABC-type antimicrobial peptide transport system permease subunit
MTFAVVGVAVALATTRLMQTLLYGVSATDWKTMVIVPLGLALVVLAASYGPARRAARIDPVEALRSD